MNSILQIIGVTSVVSGVILRGIDGIVRYCQRRFGKRKTLDAAYNDAMVFLLREKLIDKTNEAIEAGYRDMRRDKELRQGYEAYVSLGGNGTMHDKWENEYSQLPIK